jgi:heme/copper-type cytochrome/quinol oxidase subunit 4
MLHVYTVYMSVIVHGILFNLHKFFHMKHFNETRFFAMDIFFSVCICVYVYIYIHIEIFVYTC